MSANGERGVPDPDAEFTVGFSQHILRLLVTTAKEHHKHPGHILQVLEHVITGIVIAASQPDDWQQLADSLLLGVKKRLQQVQNNPPRRTQ